MICQLLVQLCVNKLRPARGVPNTVTPCCAAGNSDPRQTLAPGSTCSGVTIQFSVQNVVDGTHPVGTGSGHVHIVESEQPLSFRQLSLNLKCSMLSQTKHQCVTLFTSFALVHVMHCARVICPQILRWLAVEQPHEWQCLRPSCNIPQCTQHCCPRNEVSCPNPSMEIKVHRGSTSVRACKTWAMHSVPALVVIAHWKSAVAASTALLSCWDIAGHKPSENVSCHNAPDPSAWFLQRCQSSQTNRVIH